MEKKDIRELIKENHESKYHNLFSEKQKIEAFDQIAKNYYYGNFGTMQKSDLDTLLFSFYLNAILDKNIDDENAYSDYQMSKDLGITQTRIRSLKERKQLIYPYEKFDWKEAFLRVCRNARYKNGDVVINIRDVNLYIELKNRIESNGGYLDTSLSSTTLKMPIEYFVDLMMEVLSEENRSNAIKEIKKIVKSNGADVYEYETKSFGELFQSAKTDVIADVSYCALNAIFPFINDTGKEHFKDLLRTIENKLKKGEKNESK